MRQCRRTFWSQVRRHVKRPSAFSRTCGSEPALGMTATPRCTFHLSSTCPAAAVGVGSTVIESRALNGGPSSGSAGGAHSHGRLMCVSGAHPPKPP